MEQHEPVPADATGDGTEIASMEATGRLLAELEEERGRAAHWQRLVAAILAKLGPIEIRASEYGNARPGDIQTWESFNLFGPDDPDTTAVFALPEHAGDHEGMVTRDETVIAALLRSRDNDMAGQARAVLAALGLPARPED